MAISRPLRGAFVIVFGAGRAFADGDVPAPQLTAAPLPVVQQARDNELPPRRPDRATLATTKPKIDERWKDGRSEVITGGVLTSLAIASTVIALAVNWCSFSSHPPYEDDMCWLTGGMLLFSAIVEGVAGIALLAVGASHMASANRARAFYAVVPTTSGATATVIVHF